MSRYAMCPDCGRKLHRWKDQNGEWDGETYVCYYCSGEDEECSDEDVERISVCEASRIWASKGKDEDYMFGYTEEELEEAIYFRGGAYEQIQN